MKHVAAFTLAVAIALVARASIPPKGADTAAAASAAGADGRMVYAGRCNMCHKRDGSGTPVGQKMGAQDLTRTALTEAEVRAIVANGRGKMSAFRARLSYEEIAEVARYVATLKK